MNNPSPTQILLSTCGISKMSFQPEPSHASIATYRNKDTSRSCGSCSMCCYLPSLEVSEWKEPKNQWCRHCSGHSCNIYPKRPDLCQDFECMWLMCNILGDHWYPKKSKIIVTSSQKDGETRLVCAVHEKYPLRWREEPYYSDIKSWAIRGLQADTWVTEVVVRDQLWIILPDKDVLITSKYFHIIRTGIHNWDVIQMDETEWRNLKSAELRKRMAEGKAHTAA